MPYLFEFSYHNPTQIVFGPNIFAKLDGLVPADARVLLLYGGGSIKGNGVYDKVTAALAGRAVVEFAGVEPNPTLETLSVAVDLAKRRKIDFILGVGGGSVSDGAKYIACAALYGGDGWDIVSGRHAPREALPVGIVLTLPTGSPAANSPCAPAPAASKSSSPRPSKAPAASPTSPPPWRPTRYTAWRRRIGLSATPADHRRSSMGGCDCRRATGSGSRQVGSIAAAPPPSAAFQPGIRPGSGALQPAAQFFRCQIDKGPQLRRHEALPRINDVDRVGSCVPIRQHLDQLA